MFQPRLLSQTCKLDRLTIGCTCFIGDVYNFIDKMAADKLECLSFIHPGYVMLSTQSYETQTRKAVHTLEIYTSLPWECIRMLLKLFAVDKLVIGYPPFHSYPVQEENLTIDVGNAHVVRNIVDVFILKEYISIF